jgi:hypothetical protein
MIALALFVAAQGVPQRVMAAADEANGAFVQCLFATSRAANAARLGVDDFEHKLAGSCLAEEQELVRTGAAVMRARSQPNAEATVRQEAADARRSVVNTFRETLKFRP